MTPLQHKINLVEQYLFHMGKRDKDGKPIKIVFKNQDNSHELYLLDIAYDVALKFYAR